MLVVSQYWLPYSVLSQKTNKSKKIDILAVAIIASKLASDGVGENSIMLFVRVKTFKKT